MLSSTECHRKSGFAKINLMMTFDGEWSEEGRICFLFLGVIVRCGEEREERKGNEDLIGWGDHSLILFSRLPRRMFLNQISGATMHRFIDNHSKLRERFARLIKNSCSLRDSPATRIRMTMQTRILCDDQVSPCLHVSSSLAHLSLSLSVVLQQEFLLYRMIYEYCRCTFVKVLVASTESGITCAWQMFELFSQQN